MGQLNKRALLARLQVLGVASRAELAKSLGLSQPTTGKIVDDLLQIGLVREFDSDRQREVAALGRPGRRRFCGIWLRPSSAARFGRDGAAWKSRVLPGAGPPAWRRQGWNDWSCL